MILSVIKNKMTKKIFTLVALTVAAISLAGCFSKTNTITTDSGLPTTGDSLTEATIPNDQPYEYINKEK
jgi:hypothetical protein